MPQKTPIQSSVKYDNGYPIVSFVLIFLPILLGLIGLYHQVSKMGLITYLSLGALLFYFFFARYSCRVCVEDSLMKIGYLEPWRQDVCVDISIYSYFHYGRSSYSFLAENSIGFSGARRFYCFDLLLLSENPNQVQLEIKMNTRMFGFKRLISILQNDGKLKKAKLEGSSVFIW